MVKINNFALIVGAMKCGTTSLFSYLSQHPQIAACSKKEAFFFSDDKNWTEGFEWYQQLWNWNPDEHKIALEASVDYTRIPTYPNAAERIYSLKDKANFKFIYIMRNPIERIESHYTHGKAQGWRSTQKPLTEEIDKELLEASQYARQIEEYYQRFSRDRILLLNFEDLKTDPLNLIKKTCCFLEIDSDYQFQRIGKIYNANQERIADERLWRLLRKIKPLRSLKGKLTTKQKQYAYYIFGRKITENFKLPLKQRNYVLNQLKEDLEKLSLDYDFDITRWTIDP
jgi:Sulfotransferase domain